MSLEARGGVTSATRKTRPTAATTGRAPTRRRRCSSSTKTPQAAVDTRTSNTDSSECRGAAATSRLVDATATASDPKCIGFGRASRSAGLHGEATRADLEERRHVLEVVAAGETDRPGREPVEEGRDADSGHDPRQRGTRTHVCAVPEREVLVCVRTIVPERRAVVEDALVPVCRPCPHDHTLARVHRRLRDRRVVHATARDEQDGRREPQALFDGAGERGIVGAHGLVEIGHGEELVEEVAEKLAGRRETTGDEVAGEGAQLPPREAHAVDLET